MDHRESYATRGVREREAGLRRIGKITRVVLLGSLTLTGAVAVAAARSFPGHTKASTASTSSSTTAGSSSSTSASSSSGESSATQSVQPAASAPAASSSVPATVSGGS